MISSILSMTVGRSDADVGGGGAGGGTVRIDFVSIIVATDCC